MKPRVVNVRSAAALARRHGAVALLVAVVVGAFAALTALSLVEQRGGNADSARQAAVAAAGAARAVLDRQQGLLDRLAATVAASDTPGAATRQLLDLTPSLAPGLRETLLFDPTGVLVARSGPIDPATIAGLGNEAVPAALAAPGAAMLVTRAARDAGLGLDLIGLAHAWFAGDGTVGGVVLLAIDRSAFAGLDRLAGLAAGGRVELMRADGTPLFGEPTDAGDGAFRRAAIAGLPLAVRYYPPEAAMPPMLQWRLGLLAAGLLAALALAGLLIRRRGQAAGETARRDRVEAGLRAELAELTAAIDRTDETSRSKSHFFAQVTHELRTPLTAILGFSETIRQEMFGPVANPRYREYAGLIHDAGAHLLSLINDLLDSARIEAGKMEIAPIRVSAMAAARSALDLVDLSAEARGIAVTASLHACPDLNVDPRAFKQVLVNLLSNAIKFTLPGGRVDVGFAPRGDGGVTITVADTGIGMSAEDVRLAFEPFGRGHRARLQEGTGLGLSLARALVRLHGGDLTLSSRLGAGTTAAIALPASAAFAAAEPVPRPAQAA